MMRVDRREVESAQVNALPQWSRRNREAFLAPALRVRQGLHRGFSNAKSWPRRLHPPLLSPLLKQQQEIRANGGRPPAVSQMRQGRTENTQQARPNIRIAPASQVAAPQNVRGQRVRSA